MLNYYEYADLVRLKEDQDKRDQVVVKSTDHDKTTSASSTESRRGSRIPSACSLTPIPESRDDSKRGAASIRHPRSRVERASSIHENSTLRVENTTRRCHSHSAHRTDTSRNAQNGQDQQGGVPPSSVDQGGSTVKTGQSQSMMRNGRSSGDATGRASSTAETVWTNGPVMTIPVPAGPNPVMLEVCINVLSPDKKAIERSYTVVPGVQNEPTANGAVSQKEVGSDPRSVVSKSQYGKPVRYLIPPKTGSSVGGDSTINKLTVTRSIKQKQVERRPSTNNAAENRFFSRMTPDTEIFLTREPNHDDLSSIQVTDVRQKHKLANNSLYQIPRPKAPIPCAQGDITDKDQPENTARPMLSSPKYTEYALQYQDRNNFKNQNHVNTHLPGPETSAELDGQQVYVDNGVNQKPTPNIQDHLVPPVMVEARDQMVQKRMVTNPGNYRAATALRIRIPMESERLRLGNVKHAHSMEDVRSKTATKTPAVERFKGNGQLRRYPSDPMVSSRELSDDYIDTYQVEMELMRRKGTGNRPARPSTPAVGDVRSEKANIEAERRRKQKLLHSAIRGWGSTTMVLRPKSDKKQLKYTTPLMITAVGRSNQRAHHHTEVSQKAPEQHNYKLDPEYHDQQALGGDNNNSQVCQLKIRLQRKSRPTTSIPRPVDTNGGSVNKVTLRPRTASSANTKSDDLGMTQLMTIGPVPGTAMARNFRQLQYNRPNTAGVSSQQPEGPDKAMRVLNRLVIHGNQLRTETPLEEFPPYHSTGEENWGFMAEFDEKGRPKTPKELPDHVNMYSPNVPNTSGGNYGSRLNSEVGMLMQQMEFSFNSERRKKKLGNDLICY